jgi:hypothetical protein
MTTNPDTRNEESSMTAEENTTTRTHTEWRLTYDNDNPCAERVGNGLITPLGGGRYRHDLRSQDRAWITRCRELAQQRGASGITVQHREVRTVTTRSEWQTEQPVRLKPGALDAISDALAGPARRDV